MAAHSHSHKHYHILLIVFLIFAVLVGLKFVSAKSKWHSYVVQSQTQTRMEKFKNSVEDASVIATTIVAIPPGNPLLSNPAALEEYVKGFSKATGRDLVIVDNNGKILADTFPANVGNKYGSDQGGEVAKTIADGTPRGFVEKSSDYPKGINETVVQFKNTRGQVVGAIIISDSNIF